MDRLDNQRMDAAEKLRINLPNTYSSAIPQNNLMIFLGGTSGEELSLAKAVSNYIEKINKNVILIMEHLDIRKGTSYLNFDGTDFFIGYVPENYDFSMQEGQVNSDLVGNSYLFKKYSESKHLSGIILDKSGLDTPKGIVFKGTTKEIDKAIIKGKVLSFFEKIGNDKSIVLKPSGGHCGEGVCIFGIDKIEEIIDYLYKNKLDTILLQEKVNSYPIYIDNIKKDWNLRVLVTFDTENYEYIVSGIVGRIDNEGGPINRSLGADYMSLRDLLINAGLNNNYDTIKESVEKAAINSVKNIIERLAKKKRLLYDDYEFDESTDIQVLSGIDIILDENCNPVILEVNDSNSGCLYELMLLDGVGSLEPIAKCIIDKINLKLENDSMFQIF